MSRQPTRIICIGSRFCPTDLAGPLIYDRLTESDLPTGIEAIDGGLGGLDLLRFIEGARRVIFVDSVSGFRGRDQVVVLDATSANPQVNPLSDHDGGLAWLLRRLPRAIDGEFPEIHVVGIKGFPCRQAVADAAFLILEVALQGAENSLPASVH